MKKIEQIGERFRRITYRPNANKGQEWEAQARGTAKIMPSGRNGTTNDTHAFGSTCDEALDNLIKLLK